MLKRWIHPKTNEIRIYINAPGLYAKVWLTQSVEAGVEFISENHRHNDIYEYPSLFNNGLKPWEAVVVAALHEAGLDWDTATWDDLIDAAA